MKNSKLNPIEFDITGENFFDDSFSVNGLPQKYFRKFHKSSWLQ